MKNHLLSGKHWWIKTGSNELAKVFAKRNLKLYWQHNQKI